MKRFFCVMVSVVALLGCVTVASASQKDEAKGLVKKAVAFLKKNGNEKGLAEFSKSQGPFVKGELYVFALDSKGTVVAHGGNQKLIGKNMHDLKDPDGKYFIQDMLKAGKQGGGWTEYKWTNPSSKKIEAKMTFMEASGDLTIGCGFYK